MMMSAKQDLTQPKTLCTARRRNGTPCRNAPMLGSNVCRMHGGAAPQVRRRAEQRILEASDKAAAHLVALMQNPKVPYAVQFQAARDLLDRAGLNGKKEFEVEVKVPRWLEVANEILVDIVPDEQIEDAVIVEEPDTDKADREMALRDVERRKPRAKGYSGTLRPSSDDNHARVTRARTKGR